MQYDKIVTKKLSEGQFANLSSHDISSGRELRQRDDLSEISRGYQISK